jgi:hypothetical protein
MRQSRSPRNGRPIKLLNRSGATIQNFNTSGQMIAARSTTLAGQFGAALAWRDFPERVQILEL